MVLDAVGNPQTILLLGGTSEIGLAICERYLRNASARVVLADQLRPRARFAPESGAVDRGRQRIDRISKSIQRDRDVELDGHAGCVDRLCVRLAVGPERVATAWIGCHRRILHAGSLLQRREHPEPQQIDLDNSQVGAIVLVGGLFQKRAGRGIADLLGAQVGGGAGAVALWR